MADAGSTALAPGWSTTRRLATDLSRADIARYAGASGDVNLVHVDEPFATQAAGHPSVIAHGMLTMGLTGSFLASLVGQASVRRFGGRFVAPVLAGDSLDCTATIRSATPTEAGTELIIELHTTKSDGTPVFIGEATATPEQEIEQ